MIKPIIIIGVDARGCLTIQGPQGEDKKPFIIATLADAIKIMASAKEKSPIIQPEVVK